MLVPYRQQLAALLDGQIGTTRWSCFVARRAHIERRAGDPARATWSPTACAGAYSTQLALMNGGGIRAPMPSLHATRRRITCAKRPCAGYAAGPPYDLVLGDVFSVLPFGNILNTRTVTGAQLWLALENGVRAIDSAGTGRRPVPADLGIQVLVPIRHPDVAARARRRASSTACSRSRSRRDARSRTTRATYTMALPNFVNLGGDGYYMFADGQGATQELDARRDEGVHGLRRGRTSIRELSARPDHEVQRGLPVTD